jgi:ribosomal-protein-alanine N-acetyltransferase
MVPMIRTFTLSDLSRLLDVERHSFPKSAYDASTFIALHYLHPETFLVHVDPSDPGGGLSGYIVFSPDGHVVSMAVLPEFRRRGIGRDLIQKAMSYPGIKTVRVEVRRSNRGAQAFYLKTGFGMTGRIPDYYGDEDALVMIWTPSSH